jgi:hypothetical protein
MKKRVKIPKQNAKALLDLVTKVRAKHVADGDTSPLKVLNWDEINSAIAQALEAEEKALQFKRETLSLYQQRAQALETVVNIVRDTRDILTGVHRKKMKLLGLWGFDVLDGKVTLPVVAEETPPAAAA